MTVAEHLARVTAALPASEARPGQQQMAIAVDAAIRTGRHLAVQAGTGTGKTLAYLVPALLSGKRVVVATATKALQDQLASNDLPFLEQHLGQPFAWAVLKGRSNYLCLQRVRELTADQAGRLELDDLATTTRAEIQRLVAWATTSPTGDLAELDWSPAETTVRAVTVGSDECPGRTRCPMGGLCFAEAARDRAADADVVVVNLHLYGLHIASGDAVLPDHDVVVFDEAHQIEDVMSDTVGLSLGPGNILAVLGSLRRVLEDDHVLTPLADASRAWREVLASEVGQRLADPLPDGLASVLRDTRLRLDAALGALRAIATDVDEAAQRVMRALQMTSRLADAIDAALTRRADDVAFVGGTSDHPRLEIAPLDVGPLLGDAVWSRRTAVLTSATLPPGSTDRLGIDPTSIEILDVGSPFDYPANAVLYCPVSMPAPTAAGRDDALLDEMEQLITAAGGRTLALFTSWRAMDLAAERLRPRLDVPVLTQRDLPKTALVRAFAGDERTCLFATAGFFQGVDVPGRTLSLVIIDRLPFPRPDDPLLSARRERLGPAAFSAIDLPRATVALAQATGRLIRSASDRGVVAVLDPRLGTASYRWTIVGALPPMRRTRHRHDAVAFLHECVGST